MSDKLDFDEEYLKAHRDSALPMRADYELLHADRFPPVDVWEETAFVLVAESGEDDILLWVAAYHLRGHGQNIWLVGEGAEQETELVVMPKSQRNKGLTDHDFIRRGWDPGARGKASDLIVEQDGDTVTWKLGNREYIATPPHYYMRGEHGGVDLDLTFTQVPPAFWEWGDFDGAPARDRGGYDALCRVNGTIKANGKTYVIRDATGLKERITVGQSCNPIVTLPAPREMNWLFSMKDGLGVFLFQPGKPGLDLGSISWKGEHASFRPRNGDSKVDFQVLSRWHDPRSGLYIPDHWTLRMESDAGTIDLVIRAHGRCWFNWVLANGIRMNAFMLCTANGTAQMADGSVIAFEDELLALNWLRAYSTTHETMSS